MHIVVIGGWAPSLVGFREPLLRALVAAGHKVTTLAADGDATTRAQLHKLGVAFEEIPLTRTGLDPRADLLTIIDLTRRLKRLAPDVVLSYTIKPIIYGGIAAQLARIPRRYALITGLGYAFMGQDKFSRRVLSKVVARLYRLGLAGVQGVFVQNPDDQADLLRAGAATSRTPFTLVRGSGVDTNHFAAAELPAPSHPITFLFVGRLLREKGIAEFAAMASAVRLRHPSAIFRIVGWLDPNPTSLGAAELSDFVGCGDLEYLGETRDVRPHLAACHVLVLPSYREGTPRSVLEAMSVGRPIITTDVPGCRETIVHGEHGYLVPPRDVAALVAAAENLINDSTICGRMGVAARNRAVSLYNADAVAAHMLRVMHLDAH